MLVIGLPILSVMPSPVLFAFVSAILPPEPLCGGRRLPLCPKPEPSTSKMKLLRDFLPPSPGIRAKITMTRQHGPWADQGVWPLAHPIGSLRRAERRERQAANDGFFGLCRFRSSRSHD